MQLSGSLLSVALHAPAVIVFPTIMLRFSGNCRGMLALEPRAGPEVALFMAPKDLACLSDCACRSLLELLHRTATHGTQQRRKKPQKS